MLPKRDYKENNMPQTLLARKSGAQDMAIATDDETHAQLVSDPTVGQFQASNSFGGTNNGFGVSNNGSATFGSSPAAGFNSSGGYSPQGSGFGGSGPGSAPQPNLTQAGENAAQGAEVLVKNDNSDWINKKWRPAMGWMYMLTCTVDFVVFPVLWSLLQALSKGSVTTQWQPLTLQGAGLYHIAMGAVLGIAAYGRTKEKLEGAAK